ncbi:MAG: hypothetical protein Kow00103_12260 [Candidatus Caldatribacteriota bacterium]
MGFKRDNLKRIRMKILNFFEIYLPSFVFFLLFIVFMLQIIFRYFFIPLTWPEEFVQIAFIWVTLLGACFAQRESSHVKFTMIYDKVKPKTQIWMRIIGNILVLIAFSISLYPSYRYVNFMSFKKSDVLKIPMNIAFAPYIVFLILIILRLGFDIVTDFKKLSQGEK